jgi:hypothetical protein
MNLNEFNALSKHLSEIAELIPLRWGKIQNDNTDGKINMFTYNNFQTLENAIRNFPNETQDYFKKRWFLWKCAQCDEFLFYRHLDIVSNPNHKDQDWDFEFFGNSELRFDLKGTLVPREIKERYPGIVVPNNSMEIIKFNYEHQSKGVRNNHQNRLFLIHIPRTWNRENTLRANFPAKSLAIDCYINLLRRKQNYIFFNFEGVKTDIIYLIENSNNSIRFEFASSSLNGE